MEESGRTRVCSVLFIDIVDYSRRDVAEQVRLKNIFNLVMTSALGVEPEERVVVDTGDGAAVTFLGDPERALYVGLEVFDNVGELPVRMGINLGPVSLMKDLNGLDNVIGDGINVAQRIMSFAGSGELMVSRQFYDIVSRLSDDYAAMFKPKALAHRQARARVRRVLGEQGGACRAQGRGDQLKVEEEAPRRAGHHVPAWTARRRRCSTPARTTWCRDTARKACARRSEAHRGRRQADRAAFPDGPEMARQRKQPQARRRGAGGGDGIQAPGHRSDQRGGRAQGAGPGRARLDHRAGSPN